MRIRMPAICILLLVFCTGAIFAQSTSGTITGTVVDSQQAAIANAAVTVKEEGKAFTLTATSDENGRFVFPIVPPGTYTIVVKANGFKANERKGAVLVLNDKLSLGSIELAVGAVTETVEVSAEATLVQADSGDRSYAIQSTQVQSLGNKGRSYINFATLAPGVVANGAGDGTSTSSNGISVNGVRTNSNNVQIDGVTSVDTGNNAELSKVPLDSIGEFKLVTSSSQAEYGRSSGAQIIAITQSGSQDFRGSAYYYRRHRGLNANTFQNNRSPVFEPGTTNRVASTRPFSDQEDKGYRIGGPIYLPGHFNKDKKSLFFFVNQEWTPRLTPRGNPNRVRVPTALERRGDFSASTTNTGAAMNLIRDPLSALPCLSTATGANPGGCFADGGVLGRIPQNRLYAPGVKLLNLYPLPNTAGINFNLEDQLPNDTNERNDTFRVDYNVTENWRVSSRYLRNNEHNNTPYDGLGFILGGNIADFAWKNVLPRASLATTVYGTLNASTIVEFTYGYSKNSIDGRPANNKYTRTAANLTDLPLIFSNATQGDYLPQVGFGGGPLANTPSFRVGNGPFINSNRTDTFVGSLSKITGNHVLKFGGNYERGIKKQTNRVQFNGGISFSFDAANPFETGNGFSNALLGVYQNYIQASTGTEGKYKYNNTEFYAQDNWKITRRLTLDYGMRFSWFPPTYDASGAASNFDPTKYSAANAPLLYAPGCLGQAVGSFVPCTGNNRVAYDPRLPVGTILTGTGTNIPGAGLNSANGGLFIGKIIPGTGSTGNGLYVSDKALTKDQGLLFAPRFGFAYDLTGKHNLILRGGFGIFYDRSQGNLVFDYNENPPTTITQRYDYGLLSNLTNVSATSNRSVPTIRAIEQDAKIPSTNSYNIGIQYKLPFDAVLDIAYVGSQGHHLPHIRPINETPFGSHFLAVNTDPTRGPSPAANPAQNALLPEFFRPYKGYGGINMVEFNENSNYHSLQMGANRRFSQGLVVSANYTLGKARGVSNADDTTARFDGNTKINYGRLGFDRTHVFNLNWVYELPALSKNKVLGFITKGWQFSGIYRYQSGEPELVSCGVNNFGTTALTGSTGGGITPRCVLISNPKAKFNLSEFRLFNLDAFQAPSIGSTGTETNRDALLVNAPPINNFDLSLSKKFYFWEKLNVEARLDAFNAFNHTQGAFLNFFGANYTAPGSATLVTNNAANATSNRTGYGAVNGYRPNRTMQWMLRFSF
jgi:Carboxypeptidase regulatory-like domain/TonB-dependent Receptor Plug Domain